MWWIIALFSGCKKKKEQKDELECRDIGGREWCDYGGIIGWKPVEAVKELNGGFIHIPGGEKLPNWY